MRARLAALASDAERLKALVELVQEDIAAVLAMPGASSVPVDMPLKELGLDSLMAVELRNRLSARVGTKLPTTLAFDYPTATAMAQLLVEKLELESIKPSSVGLGRGADSQQTTCRLDPSAPRIGPPGAHHDATERHLTSGVQADEDVRHVSINAEARILVGDAAEVL